MYSANEIVFDYKDLQPECVLATAAVALALGIAYWRVSTR